ncbi:hypothetical protein SteCoe_5822 [Stentor coeruleus]|uniref:Protein YIPF n=1 Tax=Stentor coeruleus TaxID=5963 RepID=A0A1R2CRG4_9CILI|nr:hypothetical protein SteCoe_5822 [Stentor coeruleus]
MSELKGNIPIDSPSNSQSIQGKIDLQSDSNSLNEPVIQTILHDLKRICYKLKCVMIPRLSNDEKSKELRDWDLWGPLILCLMLALTLSLSSDEYFIYSNDTGTLIFSIVFVVVWIGSAVVTINAQLLGGTVSFFHSVCLLGYCLFPLNIAALILAFIGDISVFINLVLVVLGLSWSTFSSIGFMAGLVPSTRKALAEYPVLLFYLFLAWLILMIF